MCVFIEQVPCVIVLNRAWVEDETIEKENTSFGVFLSHRPRSIIEYQQEMTGGAVSPFSNRKVHKITVTFLPHNRLLQTTHYRTIRS